MTRLPRTTCRNCRGSGATSYHGESVVCGSCLGTGRRFPDTGDYVYSGNPDPIGDLEWRWTPDLADPDIGTFALHIAVMPGFSHLLLPTIEEVDMAEREDAHPCQSE